jgi:hypothetical protein
MVFQNGSQWLFKPFKNQNGSQWLLKPCKEYMISKDFQKPVGTNGVYGLSETRMGNGGFKAFQTQEWEPMVLKAFQNNSGDRLF